MAMRTKTRNTISSVSHATIISFMIIIMRNIHITSGFMTFRHQRTTSIVSSCYGVDTKLYAGTSTNLNWIESIQQQFFSTTTMDNNNNDNQKKYYTIGITGASGLVGTALRNELTKRTTVCGKPIRIIQLKRSNTIQEFPQQQKLVVSNNNDNDSSSIIIRKKDITIRWNPMGSNNDIIHPSVISEIDTIVHLAGENVATGLGPLGFLGIRPWTNAKKDEIINSRTLLTSALSKAISSNNVDHPIQFISASGVGIYGNDYISDQNSAVDESMDTTETKGFLADVSRAWEQATTVIGGGMKNNNNKKNNNGRIIQMRFGVVQSLMGGALSKLYPIFYLGGGGIVGNGQQYLSYISLYDIIQSIIHIIETPSIKSGPINICTPNPCTNIQYTKALGTILNRPTILPLPSFIVQLLFGEMGDEMLLGGVRVLPTKLLQSGYQFKHPTINDVLNYAINEEGKTK